MREIAKLRRTNTDFGQVGMDCYVEFREAVRLGDHADLDEGFAQFTHHRTHSRPKPPVKAISTIHKAKGLECDGVFVMSCDAQIFADNVRCDIELGDVLLNEAEKIVGIAAFWWPIAVTLEQGHTCGLKPGEDPLKIGGLTPAPIAIAVKLAPAEGWSVDAGVANAPVSIAISDDTASGAPPQGRRSIRGRCAPISIDLFHLLGQPEFRGARYTTSPAKWPPSVRAATSLVGGPGGHGLCLTTGGQRLGNPLAEHRTERATRGRRGRRAPGAPLSSPEQRSRRF
jgi:hypothetical protein